MVISKRLVKYATHRVKVVGQCQVEHWYGVLYGASKGYAGTACDSTVHRPADNEAHRGLQVVTKNDVHVTAMQFPDTL